MASGGSADAMVMVTEVVAGVHVLGSARFNWYLIEEGGRFTVVDAGLPAHWSQLTALLALLGAELSEVEAVLLTHGHGDHAGNAERIRAEARARVHAHTADHPDLREGRAPTMSLAQLVGLCRPALASFVSEMIRGGGAPRFPAVTELEALEDGSTLPVPGRPRVVAVPGHTAGSCALHLSDAGVVFTGDALLTYNAAAPSSARRGPQLAADAWQEDAEQALRSLDRLESLDAHTVLPGHGQPWTGGIGEAVRCARRRR